MVGSPLRSPSGGLERAPHPNQTLDPGCLPSEGGIAPKSFVSPMKGAADKVAPILLALAQCGRNGPGLSGLGGGEERAGARSLMRASRHAKLCVASHNLVNGGNTLVMEGPNKPTNFLAHHAPQAEAPPDMGNLHRES
jgi:hypothetical protein